MAGRGLLRTFGVLPRRPFAITVMAVGFLVWGLITALGGLGAAMRGDVLRLAEGAAIIAASFGLWDMRQWGWFLAMAISGVSLFFAMGDALWTLIWGLAVLVLVLNYQRFQPFTQRLRRAFTRVGRA